LDGSRGMKCVVVPNLVEIDQTAKYGDFSIFPDGGRHHLEILML